MDERFIGELLDDRMEGEITWDDGVPHDSKRLDRFFRKISGRLTTAHTYNLEIRAQLSANIQERYENPQIKLVRPREGAPGIAIVDYGHIPGEWYEGRGGWHYRSENTNGYDLASEDITRGFRLAHQAFPGAVFLIVRGHVFSGSSEHLSEYQYSTVGGSLYYIHNLSRNYSVDEYPLEQVLSGEVNPSEVEMDGVMDQSPKAPMILNMGPLESPHGYLVELYEGG